MDKYIGKRLDGRYEILELIGVGGMANVYKARDLAEDRVVAVKILREEYRSNEEFLRRFKNESKAIAMLDHPNIVKVYDVIFNTETQSIVMEYIDGISLKEYIDQQGVLKWKEAVYFTVQILRGLQHAHDRGIVHRDIKPQNIMLLYDGTIKITDFGIARFARAETRTLTDRAIGSVHYISPEQARGEITDEKADLYSVGVMLFEMLTGQLPFDADSPVSVAIKQIQSIPKRPRELNPDIPEGLEAITIRAMQKDASKRYHSAAEMLRDIEEFKKNPSISFEYKYLSDGEPQEIAQSINRGRQGATARQAAAARRRKPAPAQKQHVPAQRGGMKQKRAAGAQRPEEEGMPKEKDKAPVLPVLGGVAGAFLLVSALFIFWMFYTNNPFESTPEVRLPDFVGERYSTVKEKYGDKFKLVAEQDYSNEYEQGVVFEQTPRAGTRKVRLGSTITLKVSTGSKKVAIDDYAGQEVNKVLDDLHEKGLKATQTSINHPTVERGKVIRTDPPKGSEVTIDTPITVYVSLGADRQMREVPNLVGMDLDTAKATLAILKLKVGTVTHVSYDDLPVNEDGEVEDEPAVGEILEQSPEPQGEGDSAMMVEEGSAIDVSIYDGNSSVVRMLVKIRLPENREGSVVMTAEMDGSTVKTETVDKAASEWVVTFSSEYETETAYIYLDGRLYQELELNFSDGTHRAFTGDDEMDAEEE